MRQALRRTEDVDIKSDGNGGYYVGWIQESEYLSYSVEVSEDGEPRRSTLSHHFLIA